MKVLVRTFLMSKVTWSTSLVFYVLVVKILPLEDLDLLHYNLINNFWPYFVERHLIEKETLCIFPKKFVL